MGEGALFRELCRPQEGPEGFDAVQDLLASPNPGGLIDRVFVPLLHHKTMLRALDRLERAGGDLAELTVSGRLFPSIPPLNQVLPQVGPARARVSLARVRQELERLQQLNRRVISDLVDRGPPGRFLLLSGRAFDAAYPRYAHRMDFDSDLFVPTLAEGIELGMTIAEDLGFALKRFRVSRLQDGGLAWAGLVRTTPSDFRVNLGFFVGGCLMHRGGQLQWMELPFWERARQVHWDGGSVHVPSPEDMVLLSVARIRRKGMVIRRDAIDLQFLLEAEGDRLDWDYISPAAAAHHLGGVLHSVLGEVEEVAHRPLVPADVLKRFAHDGIETRLYQRAHVQAPADGQTSNQRYPMLVSPLGRHWQKLSFIRSVLAMTGRSRALVLLTWLGLRKAVFGFQWKIAHRNGGSVARWRPFLGALRPGYGSLCEFAAPTERRMSFCLSQRQAHPRRRPRWAPLEGTWDQLVTLLRLRGEDVAASRTKFDRHQCWMFQIDLSGIHAKDQRGEASRAGLRGRRLLRISRRSRMAPGRRPSARSPIRGRLHARVHPFLQAERAAFRAYGVDARSVELELSVEPFRARLLRADGPGVPLLLVHGGGAVPVLWAPLLPALRGFQVFVLELPGHGASPPVDYRDVDLSDFAARYLTAVLDAIGVPRVAVAASSLGGLWSFPLAGRHPERVSALIQVGPTALAGDPALLTGRRLIASWRITRCSAWDDRRVRNILRTMGAARDGHPDLVRCLVSLDRLPDHWSSLESLLDETANQLTEAQQLGLGQFSEIGAPTLFILGEQDYFARAAIAAGAYTPVPNATIRSVPGGHLTWFHDPDHVGAEIVRFLGMAVVPGEAPPFLDRSPHPLVDHRTGDP